MGKYTLTRVVESLRKHRDNIESTNNENGREDSEEEDTRPTKVNVITILKT